MNTQNTQHTGHVEEGTTLWEPSLGRITKARITDYLAWLAREQDLVFTSYEDLWRWSVDHLEEFWSSLWAYFALPASSDGTRPPVAGGRWGILSRARGVEGASWFDGTELNYVDQVLRHPRELLALVAVDEGGTRRQLTYGELINQVGAAAAGLKRLGVRRGDRVAAVLPNGPEAVIAFLATASIGAIWSSCAPEFGAPSMIDRFRQVGPKILLSVRLPLPGRPLRRVFEADRSRARPAGSRGDRGRRTRRVGHGARRVGHGARRDGHGIVHPHARAWDRGDVGRSDSRGGAGDTRARPLCTSPVDPVLLGHHGTPEADRPRPRRDPARAPQVPRPPL